MYVELLRVFLTHLPTWHRRAILHNYHLEVVHLEPRKAVEQFVHLVGAVVNGNNKTILHCLSEKGKGKNEK